MLLSQLENIIAKHHLTATWKRMTDQTNYVNINQASSRQTNSCFVTSDIKSHDDDEDDLEKLLKLAKPC